MKRTMLDEMDVKDLYESYDINLISKLDINNVNCILDYLYKEGIYFAKDIFMEHLSLFLFTKDEFIQKFENLKKELGINYIEQLEENSLLLEKLYED